MLQKLNEILWDLMLAAGMTGAILLMITGVVGLWWAIKLMTDQICR